MARPLPTPPLLLITDRTQVQGDLVAVVEAACAGGCRWVSLREKDLPDGELLALFARLRAVTRPFGAVLTLHGAAALARQAQADGVHLPSGADGVAAREMLGAQALVGLSVHGVQEAQAVPAQAVDYITISPVFLTRSKPGYGPALGLDGLARCVAASALPVVALAGITGESVAPCLRAGAAGVAVMGDVMRASMPRKEVMTLVSRLTTPASA